MKAKEVRRMIEEHPDGVVIKMKDGMRYRVPNREWVWLTPAFGGAVPRYGRYARMFGVCQDGALRWVDCLLVDAIVPGRRRTRSNGRRRRGNDKSKRR